MKIAVYQKILNVGHRYLYNLFNNPVLIQEKIDGSQFSAAVLDGELEMRSKGTVLRAGEEPNGHFGLATQTFTRLFNQGKLREGWVYRGEALSKPKHNTLCYERIPKGGVILFDIEPPASQWEFWLQAGPAYFGKSLQKHAEYFDLESVPVLWDEQLPYTDIAALEKFLDRESVLGGTKIEGIVIKNYYQVLDGRPVMGKLVRPDFKERNSKNWKQENPSRFDVILRLGENLRTEARWRKAIQHLRDKGELIDAPQDIGPLLKELSTDVWEEERHEIGEILANHFRRDIVKQVVKGFPEFYKQFLRENLTDIPAPDTLS